MSTSEIFNPVHYKDDECTKEEIVKEDTLNENKKEIVKEDALNVSDETVKENTLNVSNDTVKENTLNENKKEETIKEDTLNENKKEEFNLQPDFNPNFKLSNKEKNLMKHNKEEIVKDVSNDKKEEIEIDSDDEDISNDEQDEINNDYNDKDIVNDKDYYSPKLRYFRLLSDTGTEGRFCGLKPKQAANKAFTSLIKSNKYKNGEDVKFKIQECTRGSKKRQFTYSGKRTKLDNPIHIQIGSAVNGNAKIITYNYSNEIQKIKD
ncbi:MAG: hypothetical protein Edafosvirus6_15 [Edafosvirus sp.]|uniref:Chromosomal protein MC1 domain-containing protein n=1 Tax=Edafosvirus sp. TaxID=2487765 RepID=A0A3G4ZTE1_9VIRU|nr:MAG: hypothetical protein Edafosvirus6_15 [Edafosvirus sp.]